MRKSLALLFTVLLMAACLSWGQARKKPRASGSVSKTAAAKTATRKTAVRKTTASKKRSASAKNKRRSSRASRRRSTWRSRQTAPDPARYREIQQALIDKGYLQGPATGVWNSDSVDALRRFQREQNLEPDGKIDSLSLIALGLGPKYETPQTLQQP